jgi:hypothetical protein
MNTPLSISSTESPTQDMSTVLLSDVDTAGTFALAAITLPPYDPGAPSHTHPQHTEGCYVLTGTLALTQSEQGGAGASWCDAHILESHSSTDGHSVDLHARRDGRSGCCPGGGKAWGCSAVPRYESNQR